MAIVLLSGLVISGCDGEDSDNTPSNEISSSPSDNHQNQQTATEPNPNTGQTSEGDVHVISAEHPAPAYTGTLAYPIVDTGQSICYDNSTAIAGPQGGEAFYGQDAQYTGNQPGYTLSEDGLTVYDNVTGLTWTQSPDWNGDGVIDSDDEFIFSDFLAYPDTLNTRNYGGYNDWRTPTIKELYSLIDFGGTDPMVSGDDTSGLIPFIDTDYFDFAYGDMAAGERIIDSQFWSGTEYVSTTMAGFATTFGVNFADGRIKGYGRAGSVSGGEMNQYALFVRGNPDYGANDFIDNGDGTITDNATGLMWAQEDSGEEMNWEDALAWVEEMNDQNYLGYSDWRLPNAKELQSIVDYSRSPDTTDSAAIDPVFNVTRITNEAGQADYPFFWSSTTHLRQGGNAGAGAYVSFGRGLGSMDGTTVIDVHGAGCQRSDPKTGDPDDYPSWGHGPQGDMQRVFNYVRLVRGGDVEFTTNTDVPTGASSSNSSFPMQNDLPGGSPPAGGTPPQEAIDACDGTCTGCACQFETPRGTVEGTCQTIQGQSACVPQGGPPQ